MTINEEVLKQIRYAYSWGTFRNTFKHTLENLYKEGLLDLQFKDINLQDQTWGGELFITMREGMTSNRLINEIIAFCSADEITMLDDKVLRLWWD